jgi:hypothetical protein
VSNFFGGGAGAMRIEAIWGFAAGLFDTIKSQQAVAKRFCWKARQSFDVPFF